MENASCGDLHFSQELFMYFFFWQSKKLFRSHAFPPMNRDQRRLVHELAELYGCQTQSYDEEPVKNVVATAHKLVLG